MRTESELAAMQRHPSATTSVDDASGHVEQPDNGSAYNRFFSALEELEYAVELHGTASFEARVARDRVERARADAARTWRDRAAA